MKRWVFEVKSKKTGGVINTCIDHWEASESLHSAKSTLLIANKEIMKILERKIEGSINTEDLKTYQKYKELRDEIFELLINDLWEMDIVEKEVEEDETV